MKRGEKWGEKWGDKELEEPNNKICQLTIAVPTDDKSSNYGR